MSKKDIRKFYFNKIVFYDEIKNNYIKKLDKKNKNIMWNRVTIYMNYRTIILLKNKSSNDKINIIVKFSLSIEIPDKKLWYFGELY